MVSSRLICYDEGMRKNIIPLPTTRTYTERGTAVVSRTVLDTGTAMFFEITVLRSHRQKNPTFQGTVFMRDGMWHAEAASRITPAVVGVFADYVDAENALVARKTGLVSHQPWTGPRPQRPFRPTCRVCGWELAGGECTRPDLHWTPASVAAEDEARELRHQTRETQAA